MQSQKDLFCIFPTSKTGSDTKEQNSNSSSSKTEIKDEQAIKEKSTMPQMTTVESKISIDDYFKQKMMKRKLQQTNNSDNEKNSTQSEALIVSSFETAPIKEQNHSSQIKKQKKKRKDKRNVAL